MWTLLAQVVSLPRAKLKASASLGQNPMNMHALRKTVASGQGEADLGNERRSLGVQAPFVSSLSDVINSLGKSKPKEHKNNAPSQAPRKAESTPVEMPKDAGATKEAKPEASKESTQMKKDVPKKEVPTFTEKSRDSQNPQPTIKTPSKGGRSPSSPGEDPGFQAVVKQTKAAASRQGAHPDPRIKTAEARDAVEMPEAEKRSEAGTIVVKNMDSAAEQNKTPKFDAATFKAALKAKVRTLRFHGEGGAPNLREQVEPVQAEMATIVGNSTQTAKQPIETASKKEPEDYVSQVKADPHTELKPLKPGVPPAQINAEMASPKPKSTDEVSFDEDNKKLDDLMVESDITDEQLRDSNEPTFQEALAAKVDSQTQATKALELYRQDEEGMLGEARAEMVETSGSSLQSMFLHRTTSFSQTVGRQHTAKARYLKDREDVAKELTDLYTKTKEEVGNALSKLESEVMGKFMDDSNAHLIAFEKAVQEAHKQYEDRYTFFASGEDKDWLDRALDDIEVNYLGAMGRTINVVAVMVEDGIRKINEMIEKGWKAIDDYRKTLKGRKQKIFDEEVGVFRDKFDSLRQGVENKFNELADAMAQVYTENRKKIDDRLEEVRASTRGFFEKAFDFLKNAAKVIGDLKDLLLEVLTKAKNVALKIIKHPIRFFENLVKGITAGFDGFVKKLPEYLEDALRDWLFGQLGKTGIQMPNSLDFKGVVSLVLQVLGLTVEGIRAIAVQKFGEPTVRRLEEVSNIFKILVAEGPGGIWKYIMERIGDLRERVVEGIKSFVRNAIIGAGIKWILSLLTPASAFIKAVMSIFNIVTFIVTKARQIGEFVSAVLDSLDAIADGNISSAASKVEGALAKGLRLVIGFLASLLGLSGIGETIRDIIMKVQAPVRKAVEWVLDKAAAGAKAIGRAVVQVGVPTDPQARLEQGMKAALKVVNRFAGKPVGKHILSPVLVAVQARYGFTILEVVPDGANWAVHGKINPESTEKTSVPLAKPGPGQSESVGQAPNEIILAPKIITLDFRRFTEAQSLSYNEITEGLQHHQTALNNLTLEQWLANIDQFPGETAKKERNRVRAERREALKDDEVAKFNSRYEGKIRALASKRVEERLNQESEISEAEKTRLINVEEQKIKEEQVPKLIHMKTTNRRFDASHDADAVAGGDYKAISSLESSKVNQYIGSLWGHKKGELKDYASELKEKFKDDKDKVQAKKDEQAPKVEPGVIIKMNFRLRANFSPSKRGTKARVPEQEEKEESSSVAQESTVSDDSRTSKKGNTTKKEDKAKMLERGMKAAVSAVNKFAGKSVDKETLARVLEEIRVKHGFVVLEAYQRGGFWAIHGKMNPEDTKDTKAKADQAAQGVSGNNREAERKPPAVPHVSPGAIVKVKRSEERLIIDGGGNSLTPEQARRRVQNGKDVYTPLRDDAESIAGRGKKAGVSEIHPPDKPGTQIRFHHMHVKRFERGVGPPTGHIFYGKGERLSAQEKPTEEKPSTENSIGPVTPGTPMAPGTPRAPPPGAPRRQVNFEEELRAAGLQGGMRPIDAVRFRQVARETNSRIYVRPVEEAVTQKLDEGHSPKPVHLKVNTVSEEDTYLGRKPEERGLVAHFKPTFPDRQTIKWIYEKDPTLAARIHGRYQDRNAKFEKYKDEMDALVKEGRIILRDGLVVDPSNNKPFTGDPDIMLIEQGGNSVGVHSLPQDSRRRLAKAGMQHGAQFDLGMEGGARMGLGMVVGMIRIAERHADPAVHPSYGGSKLIVFHPDGRITYEYLRLGR